MKYLRVLLRNLNFILPVPLNNNVACIIYETYDLCANQGKCAVVNNAPICQCPSYTTVYYIGEFCEASVQVDIITITTTAKPKPVDDTVLIVAIVLPLVAFFTILTLSAVVIYYCLRR